MSRSYKNVIKLRNKSQGEERRKNLAKEIVKDSTPLPKPLDYEDIDTIRQYVNESLDKAFIYALQYSICDLVNNKKCVHLDTLAAFNEAVSMGGK